MYKSFSALGGIRIYLLCCVMGFASGVLISAGMDDSVNALMSLAAVGQVSIVWCILRGLLPFLIAAFAVKIHSFSLLSLVGFGCCLLHGCVTWLTVRSFGTAAWLVQPMLQFSGNVQIGLLMVFGRLQFKRQIGGKDFVVFVFLIAAAAFIDYFAVSPFLRSILLS